MNDITIEIEFFGSFRDYGDSIKVTVPTGSDLTAVKTALTEKLGQNAKPLIEDSALATDDTILQGNPGFEKDIKLSILPPVCGG